MAYKMKGSPAKLGTIQGTSGYSSALKQKEESLRSKERRADKREKQNAIQKRLEGIEGSPEQIAKAEAEKEKELKRIKQANIRKGETDYIAEQKALAAEEKAKGEAKTETRFDIMDALGGFLSGGGGKEGLRAAFGAGFSKKSPNEILAMQEAREARKKVTKGTEKKTNPYKGKTAKEISKMKIAAKLKDATNLSTNGDNVGEIGDVIEIPDVG
jgi:hypothetical protein